MSISQKTAYTLSKLKAGIEHRILKTKDFEEGAGLAVVEDTGNRALSLIVIAPTSNFTMQTKEGKDVVCHMGLEYKNTDGIIRGILNGAQLSLDEMDRIVPNALGHGYTFSQAVIRNVEDSTYLVIPGFTHYGLSANQSYGTCPSYSVVRLSTGQEIEFDEGWAWLEQDHDGCARKVPMSEILDRVYVTAKQLPAFPGISMTANGTIVFGSEEARENYIENTPEEMKGNRVSRGSYYSPTLKMDLTFEVLYLILVGGVPIMPLWANKLKVYPTKLAKPKQLFYHFKDTHHIPTRDEFNSRGVEVRPIRELPGFSVTKTGAVWGHGGWQDQDLFELDGGEVVSGERLAREAWAIGNSETGEDGIYLAPGILQP